MPLSLGTSGKQAEEARIELVPMIDIVFFLLAIFMLVSLKMVHLKRVPVDLPTATQAKTDTPDDSLLALSVDDKGNVFLEETLVAPNELSGRLKERFAEDNALRILVSGDQNARHGNIVEVLDIVRNAGIANVALETRSPSTN